MSDQAITNEDLKAHVIEAEEALDALRNGEVDVVIGKEYPLVILAEWVKIEMEKAAAEWQATFDAIPEGICILDEERRIIQSNKGMERLFGGETRDMVGRHCWEVAHGSDGPIANCPFEQINRTCGPGSIEVTEGQRSLKFSVYPILDDNKTASRTVHIFQDITGQKRAEEERKQLQIQLLQAQKMEAIGTLAGGIAHDFNNILSAIMGFSELIKNEVTEDSAIGQDIAQVIVAGKRASDLVQQILTFSRKSVTEKQPLRMHLIVKEALKMLRASLPTTISIEQNIDPECEVILAAPTSIHQIVINLCTNALHAMSDEKGTLAVSLQQMELTSFETVDSLLPPGPFVVLSVRDTGCGMDTTTMDRIFDPYFTTKEQGKGTGLGLAVIHGIVQDAGGFIKVQSTLGKGSAFQVFLPVWQGQSATTVPDTEQSFSPKGGSEHILIVDDEPFLVRILQRQLENQGYRVTSTTDSRVALEKIIKHPEQFDLLITDQTMPCLTGVELALAAREVNPNLHVILCTGHSDLVSREKALRMGIEEYVLKPIVGNELFRAVGTVLGKS